MYKPATCAGFFMFNETLYHWLPKPLRNERKLWRYFHQPVIYVPKRLHPNPINSLNATFPSANRWCVLPGKVLLVSDTEYKIRKLTPQMVWEYKIPFAVLHVEAKKCGIDTLPIASIAKSPL